MLLAKLFRVLFKIPVFRNRFYGFYIRLIKPFNLFDNTNVSAIYDGDVLIDLHLKDWVQIQIYFLDYFDLRGIKYLKSILKEGSTFIDIGANIGSYSLVASKLVGDNGKVFAFEPVDKIFTSLKKTISNNSIYNIDLIKKIVTNKVSEFNIYISDDSNSGRSTILENEEMEKFEVVESITLDKFIEEVNIDRIDFIKIDVEGAELSVLEGMKNVLTKFRPILFIEISPDIKSNQGAQENSITDFLSALGYEKYQANSNGTLSPYDPNYKTNYHNFAFLPI